MVLEYNLNYNHIGEKRKYKLPKKKRLKIVDSCSWTENELKNQWIFKDYNCYYIVVSKFGEEDFRVSCSGANAGTYKDLETAQLASIEFCNKLIQ